MTNNCDDDIIQQIDDAVQPRPDAATWSPTSADQSETNSNPDTITAVLLTMDGAELVEISKDKVADDIARLVGDPLFDRMSHIPDVDFWVGDYSLTTQPHNEGASAFLDRLLLDVVSGDYATSDRTRDHVRALHANPDWAPVIHGPCLVTGVDHTGFDPGPLSDTFMHWFDRLIADVDQRRQELVRAVLTELGIPEDAVQHVTIITR